MGEIEEVESSNTSTEVVAAVLVEEVTNAKPSSRHFGALTSVHDVLKAFKSLCAKRVFLLQIITLDARPTVSQIKSEPPLSTTARTPVLLVSVLELTIILVIHTKLDSTLYFTAFIIGRSTTNGESRRLGGGLVPEGTTRRSDACAMQQRSSDKSSACRPERRAAAARTSSDHHDGSSSHVVNADERVCSCIHFHETGEPQWRSGQTTRLSAGSFPDFHTWESYWTMRLVGGFSQVYLVPPALAFRRCSILTPLHPNRSVLEASTSDCRSETTDSSRTRQQDGVAYQQHVEIPFAVCDINNRMHIAYSSKLWGKFYLGLSPPTSLHVQSEYWIKLAAANKGADTGHRRVLKRRGG
ncbi:hypothetical protein PR048_001567 [Dryococelus australis]|uniref:Uncharacterized protein n=1 Tax=Dryococelus australis TaxID=614101 RepID=A0ABQ9IHN4_9NEOP|nr:hypothetical protein PR048_001567 [Dryococelus australis]